MRVSDTFRKDEGRSKSHILMLIVTLFAGSLFKCFKPEGGEGYREGVWYFQEE